MIQVIDKAGVLSPAEKARLETYVIDKCLSAINDRGWLRHVEIGKRLGTRMAKMPRKKRSNEEAKHD